MRHRTTRLTAAMLGAATLTLGLAACADGDGGTTETTTVTETGTANAADSTDASETSSSAAPGEEGFATATLKNPGGADAGCSRCRV